MVFKIIALMGLAAYAGGRYLPETPYLSSFATGILLFVFQLLCFFIYKTRIYPYYLSPFKNITGPEARISHPSLTHRTDAPQGTAFWSGHAFKEFGTAAGPIHHHWAKDIKNPNPNFFRYLVMGGEEKLVITSPEAMRQVMTNDAWEMPHWFRLGSKPILGDGLVIAEGATHRTLRKQVAPAFTPAQVRSFCPAFWDICMDMNRRITAEILSGGSKSRELNILSWTNRVTFDMIGKTAYGADFGGLEDPNKGFYRLFNNHYPLEGFTDPVDAFCVYVLPCFVPHNILDRLPIPAFQAEQRDRKIMAEEYRRLIRQVDISKFGSEDVDAVQKNLITVMVKGGQIDMTTMIENMMTFTGAGYGTNASALLWAVYELCKNPQIQARLRNEIRSILVSSTNIPTATLMDQMRYMHWFVMETARLYPSIPTSWREAMRDTEICGQVFPKGTQILTPAFHTNRAKSTWGENAEEFEPERWAPERIKKGAEHDGSLMTYSVGPKACVGKEYSLRAIKSVLIALVGNFEFSYDGPDLLEGLVPGITLRPRGGFKCVVKFASGW